MKKYKYIIQIKRRYFWEDLYLTYDKQEAFYYIIRMISLGLNVRLVGVFYGS